MSQKQTDIHNLFVDIRMTIDEILKLTKYDDDVRNLEFHVREVQFKYDKKGVSKKRKKELGVMLMPWECPTCWKIKRGEV